MNPQFLRRYLAAMALIVMISVCSTAAWTWDSDPEEDSTQFIQRFDRDFDGMVSVAEFPGPPDAFNLLDLDGDGYLDEGEAPLGPPPCAPPASDVLADFDGDGDGQLSAAEFPGPADHFNALDYDGDGFLTSLELAAGRPGPPEVDGFDKDDADRDGKVSPAEFSGPADLFDHLDADGDGYIFREEVRSRPCRHNPE